MSPHRIEVLGPGCTRCKETFRVVQNVVSDSGLSLEVVKNESYDRMMALGVMSTPGVAIDGRVVLAGHVPTPAEVRSLLGIA